MNYSLAAPVLITVVVAILIIGIIWYPSEAPKIGPKHPHVNRAELSKLAGVQISFIRYSETHVTAFFRHCGEDKHVGVGRAFRDVDTLFSLLLTQIRYMKLKAGQVECIALKDIEAHQAVTAKDVEAMFNHTIASRVHADTPKLIIQTRVHEEDSIGISAEEIDAYRLRIIQSMAVPAHLLGQKNGTFSLTAEQWTRNADRLAAFAKKINKLDDTLDLSWCAIGKPGPDDIVLPRGNYYGDNHG